MKLAIFGFSICVLCAPGMLKSQTNVFPATGNVGIGTTAPEGTLDLRGSSFNWVFRQSDAFNGAGFGFKRSRGTAASATPLQNGDEVGKILFYGFNTSAEPGSGDWEAGVIALVNGSVTGTNIPVDLSFLTGNAPGAASERMRITNSGNVGIGTTNPAYTLTVNGTIGTSQVVVTNQPLSDYVFDPAYRLAPLSEVRDFIQANHHLPDIPSDAEARQKGVDVGSLEAKLLAKIEELTLHMIQEHDRNDRLEQQNQELRARISRLENHAAK